MSEAETQQQTRRPEYLGEPTLGQVMRRPQWILALLLALAVAAGFAWLGRWQMGSAFRTDGSESVNLEQTRELGDIATLGVGVTTDAGGGVVRVGGSFMADDLRVLSPRENDGEMGAWVIGRLVTDGRFSEPDASLAVAIGWAPSSDAADAALEQLAQKPELGEDIELEGRYMPPEGPVVPEYDDDPQMLMSMAPTHLVNVWADDAGQPMYSGYLVMHPAGDAGVPELLDEVGLEAVDSIPPLPPEKVNWLNVFYAIEWVVFGGFAIFFWFRLTRDAWEKEHEMQQLLAAEAEARPDDETSNEQQ